MIRRVDYFPPREYFSAQEWAMAAVGMLQPSSIVTRGEDEAFRLRAEGVSLGQVRLARLDSGPYVNERSGPALQQGGDPTFTLALQRRGRSRMLQDGHVVELGPGDFSITEYSRPYRREYLTESSMLVILFPQQMLTIPPKALSRLVGTSLSGSDGLGAIASRFLGGIADHLAALQEPLGLTLIDSVIDVVSTLLAAHAKSGESAGAQAWQLLEIRDYIMEHLGDPELTPQRVADANFISVRQLHLMFQSSGSTVGAWIRDRRLEMCRRELVDPRVAHRSVRVIAERWGFLNQTYFAKIFRETFGYSPSSARKQAHLRADTIGKEK